MSQGIFQRDVIVVSGGDCHVPTKVGEEVHRRDDAAGDDYAFYGGGVSGGAEDALVDGPGGVDDLGLEVAGVGERGGDVDDGVHVFCGGVECMRGGEVGHFEQREMAAGDVGGVFVFEEGAGFGEGAHDGCDGVLVVGEELVEDMRADGAGGASEEDAGKRHCEVCKEDSWFVNERMNRTQE